MSTSQKLSGLIAASLFSLFVMALLPGCSKTGPAGATGPAGSTGAAGAAGATGPQGPEGNANVMVDTFSVTNAQWLWNSTYEFSTNPSSFTEYFTRYHNVPDTAITQDILNTGQVLVYFTPNTFGNANQWAPLPYEFTDASGNFNYEIAFETNDSTVRLHFFFVQLVASATIPVLSTYNIATYKFKIVAMTGTISTAMYHAGVDVGNYSAVSKFLGLDAPKPSTGLPLSPRAGGHR